MDDDPSAGRDPSDPPLTQQPIALDVALPVPGHEKFLLKDLDTGMKSYITDQEWVEKPTIKPSETRPGSSTKPPIMPTITDTRHNDRPPNPSKRSRSDELQNAHRTLRASDHVKVIAHKKRERDFANLYRWQRVRAHTGAIRVIEFNNNGTFLASAGEDTIIKIWDIDTTLADSAVNVAKGLSASGATESVIPGARVHSSFVYIRKGTSLVAFSGHTSDVTALGWSQNDFLLSGSLDKSIRLWHPRAKACLRKLMHNDMVTSVAYHPTAEQICISGAVDGMVRMWHLKERKMLSQAETDDLITSCAITPDGTTALVGTYHGRCKFYALFDEIQAEWQFKHTTQLDVRSRRAKHAQGKKICGFRFFNQTDNVLISSNDSRLRLYRLDDKSVQAKFVGHQNNESLLNGSFSPKGNFVLCAAETRMVHIWDVDYSDNAKNEEAPRREPVADHAPKKDSGIAYEAFHAQDSGMVTAALFAPEIVPPEALNLRAANYSVRTSGLVIVTASNEGDIQVFGCC